MEEITYVNEKGIVVTNSRAVFNGKTYALSNISKVSLEKAKLSLIEAIAQVILFIGFIMCVGIGLITGIFWITLLGIMCLGFWILYRVANSKIFAVLLGTSGSMFDEEVFRSNDHEFMQKVVDAINKAIVNRG